MKALHALCLLSPLLLALPVSAQVVEPAIPEAQGVSEWVTPRTEYGHPDLQGTWFFGSRTPLQRPRDLADKMVYSEAEARELEVGMQRRLDSQDAPLEADRSAPEAGSRIRQEADDAFLGHYLPPKIHKVNGEYRTSVIVEPSNGRLPVREGFQDLRSRTLAGGLADTDGPEGQPLSGRCLMFGPAIPSLTPVMMNPNLQIVQTEDYVVVMTEMIHDARIIRLNDSHHGHAIPQWMGDSVGRWEGDTLVVETRNFRPDTSHRMFLPHSEALEITEYYTLVADGEIHYAFEINDPQAYTQRVRGERIISRNAPQEKVYEYACHEGNHSLVGILRGARFQETLAQTTP